MQYDGIPGPWEILGELRGITVGTNTKREQSNRDHNASICIGPDGQPWIAWTESELHVGGGSVPKYGVWVARYNGSSFVMVTGNQADGSVSDEVEVANSTGQTMYKPEGGVLSIDPGSPQICTDGTYVYIQHGSDFGSSHCQVWQCDPGSSYSWTELPNVGTNDGGFFLKASDQDVGHPYVMRTGTTISVWRYNGSSWDLVGGSAISRPAPDTASHQATGLVIDKSGKPHVFVGTTTFLLSPSSTSTMFVYSYNGSSWIQKVFNMSEFVSADYIDSGTVQIGYTRCGPIYGEGNGKFQCLTRLNKFNATGLPLTDEGTGIGAYIFEYNCDTLEFEPFNNDPIEGHIWTLDKNRLRGIYKVAASSTGTGEASRGITTRYSYLAEPEGTENKTYIWHGNDSDSAFAIWGYSTVCPRWYLINYFQSDFSSGTGLFKPLDGPFSDTVTIEDTSSVSTTKSLRNVIGITRDNLNIYLVGRWWNHKLGYQWHSQAETYANFSADRVNETGAEELVAGSTFNAVSTGLSFNMDTQPYSDGRQLVNVTSTMGTDNNGFRLTGNIRVKVKGSSGNADFIIRTSTGTEIGRVRIGAADGYDTWVVKNFTTSITSLGSSVIQVWGGVNGGATAALVDWIEFYPTNASDWTDMKTVVYKGTIERDVFDNCPGPIDISMMRMRAFNTEDT